MGAACFFIFGNFWVLFSAPMFTQYFYDTRLVALAHVFTLGWVTLMIFGVITQFYPLAFGGTAFRTHLVVPALTFLISGVSGMVAGFALGHLQVAAIGTVLIFLGVWIFIVAIFESIRKSDLELPHLHIAASFIYLGMAAVLGMWMGLAKGFEQPLPAVLERTLFAHLHLAGLGWTGLVIIGVLSRLFPQPHLDHPFQARVRFVLINVGLVGLVAALLFGGPHRIFGLAVGVAVLWYSAAFLPVLWRFRHGSEYSTYFLVVSWLSCATCASIGLWLLGRDSAPTLFEQSMQLVYGFVYVFGWLTLMIVGMLFRMLPSHLSKFLTHRGVSMPLSLREQFDPRLQAVAWTLMVGGLIVSVLAIASADVTFFRLGWVVWMCGVGGFGGCILKLGLKTRRLLGTAGPTEGERFQPL